MKYEFAQIESLLMFKNSDRESLMKRQCGLYENDVSILIICFYYI